MEHDLPQIQGLEMEKTTDFRPTEPPFWNAPRAKDRWLTAEFSPKEKFTWTFLVLWSTLELGTEE